MVAVGSDGVDGLLEGHLDFEAHAVELDDLDGHQRQIGAKQDLAPPLGMDDQDEPDPDSDGPPDEIQGAVA